MKYWSYNEYDPDSPLADASGGYVVTLSEEEILKRYWDYWYGRMCEKFGAEHVNANYSVQDCLDDWVIGNWAWESTDVR
jgi:hypothetical protein